MIPIFYFRINSTSSRVVQKRKNYVFELTKTDVDGVLIKVIEFYRSAGLVNFFKNILNNDKESGTASFVFNDYLPEDFLHRHTPNVIKFKRILPCMRRKFYAHYINGRVKLYSLLPILQNFFF